MSGAIILDPKALWGVEMSHDEMWALIMSAYPMRQALNAIRAEVDVAMQIGDVMRESSSIIASANATATGGGAA